MPEFIKYVTKSGIARDDTKTAVVLVPSDITQLEKSISELERYDFDKLLEAVNDHADLLNGKGKSVGLLDRISNLEERSNASAKVEQSILSAINDGKWLSDFKKLIGSHLDELTRRADGLTGLAKEIEGKGSRVREQIEIARELEANLLDRIREHEAELKTLLPPATKAMENTHAAAVSAYNEAMALKEEIHRQQSENWTHLKSAISNIRW